ETRSESSSSSSTNAEICSPNLSLMILPAAASVSDQPAVRHPAAHGTAVLVSCFFGPSPILFQQRTQLVVDRLTRPKNPGPHCTYRARHGLCNFLVTHPFQFAQRDGRPQILGQFLDRPEHRFLDLISQRQTFWRVVLF